MVDNFKQFADAVNAQLARMQTTTGASKLYTVELANGDEVYNLYLSSFPKGTNPIFRESTEHDCSCCKGFIRALGNVIVIIDNKIETIWDNIDTGTFYDEIAEALAHHVRSCEITRELTIHQAKLGAETTNSCKTGTSDMETYNHFYGQVDMCYVNNSDNSLDSIGVIKRGLDEISNVALNDVLALITDNNLYRGSEYKQKLIDFIKLKAKYDKCSPEDQELFAFQQLSNTSAYIKNTVIGTLLIDISKGMPLEDAVKAFESKTAPANFKRSKALYTPRMAEEAMKTIDELGIRDSLPRRLSTLADVSTKDVLFADTVASFKMKDPLEDMLISSAKKSTPKLDTAVEISIEDFLETKLPNAVAMEAFVENKHSKNFVNLVSPVHADAPNILKWDNNFSWTYNGNITDSDIRAKVKKAGGSVTGHLRISLAWYNTDDLDIHLFEPDNFHVFFGDKKSQKTGATLDIDMNAGSTTRTDPVENITFQDAYKITDGVYTIAVDNYNNRETTNKGYTIEVECESKVSTYTKDTSPRYGAIDKVIAITMKNGRIIDISICSTGIQVNSEQHSSSIYNVDTQTFVPVELVCLSPNHWDGTSKEGNKHYMFMLKDCKTKEPVNGFFNEFLRPDLHKVRKVFEILGSKFKCPVAPEQLAGLGFSSTLREDLTCKVTSTDDSIRLYKIKF